MCFSLSCSHFLSPSLPPFLASPCLAQHFSAVILPLHCGCRFRVSFSLQLSIILYLRIDWEKKGGETRRDLFRRQKRRKENGGERQRKQAAKREVWLRQSCRMWICMPHETSLSWCLSVGAFAHGTDHWQHTVVSPCSHYGLMQVDILWVCVCAFQERWIVEEAS